MRVMHYLNWRRLITAAAAAAAPTMGIRHFEAMTETTKNR
jgi:hypothetical protein